MKKLTKAFIGLGIVSAGICGAVAIAKKATETGLEDKYFEDKNFVDEDDDYIDEEYDV